MVAPQIAVDQAGDDSAALRAKAEEDDRKRAEDAAAKKTADPAAVARYERDFALRKRPPVGSTGAERAGLISAYKPGYGVGSPENRPAGLTPKETWRSLFTPRMGGQAPQVSAIPGTSRPSVPAEVSALWPASPTARPAAAAPAPAFTPAASPAATPQPAAPVTFTPATGGVQGAFHSPQYGTGGSFVPNVGTPAMPPTATNPAHLIADEHGAYTQDAKTGAFIPKPPLKTTVSRYASAPQ